MTIGVLSTVRVNDIDKTISFGFEGGVATREVLGRRRTEVVLSVRDITHPDSDHATELFRLLLPKEALELMDEPALIDHAQKTAAVFQQGGLDLTWLDKLSAACRNIETKQIYESGQDYWSSCNRFLELVRGKYTGITDAFADFNH